MNAEIYDIKLNRDFQLIGERTAKFFKLNHQQWYFINKQERYFLSFAIIFMTSQNHRKIANRVYNNISFKMGFRL